MGKGFSASPSNQTPNGLHHPGLHAEHSSASVGNAGPLQPPTSAHIRAVYAPADHPSLSPNQASAVGSGFSALYRRSQAEGLQHDAHQRSAPPSNCSRGTQGVGQAEGSKQKQPESPKANSSSADADTPKTLRLKAMAAQTERLQQVWSVIHDCGTRHAQGGAYSGHHPHGGTSAGQAACIGVALSCVFQNNSAQEHGKEGHVNVAAMVGVIGPPCSGDHVIRWHAAIMRCHLLR